MSRFLALLLVCLLAGSQAAWGHAALLSATPAPGAVLEHAPDGIVLTFSEPVGITRLKLFDPQGKAVATGTVTNKDGVIRIPLHDDRQGTYLLSWRIISADGHPVGGTLDYAIGAPTPLSVSPPATGVTSRDTAIWLTRWLTYLCLFAAVGATLFHALHPSLRQTWAWHPLLTGALLLVLDLGLQGLDMRDVPWAGLAEPATWKEALGSTYAITLGLYALALLLAATALRAARRPVLQRGLGAVCLILAGTASAASGHAGTAPPQWLSRPAVILHVMTAIAWVGLLLPLARVVGARLSAQSAGSPAAAQRLRPLANFSTWITPVAALLTASGLTLACLQLDQLSDLWQTRYGQVLIVKLALVAALLCVAAVNRWRLTQPTLAGEHQAAQRLKLAIRVELVLSILILAAVSVWRLTPPPRSLDAGRAMISAVTLTDGRIQAQVNPGPDRWHIRLSTPGGGAFQAQAVTLLLSNPSAQIEPLRSKAQQTAPDLWQATVPTLPIAGKWRIAVEILIDDFDQDVLQAPSGNSSSDAPTEPSAGSMPDVSGMAPGHPMDAHQRK
ncbi:Copper transport protein OS=Castellaniella defragrans OX=75697 GN=HNR28_001671 PE=4 SV=1 [Castellaniella defragrans]